MSQFLITTTGSDGRLRGYTTRPTLTEAVVEFEDELQRVQDDPGASVKVQVIR
jgi:hypothetical protein